MGMGQCPAFSTRIIGDLLGGGFFMDFFHPIPRSGPALRGRVKGTHGHLGIGRQAARSASEMLGACWTLDSEVDADHLVNAWVDCGGFS